VPILFDYKDIDRVNWSKDGKLISFTATNGNKNQMWQYDLQLASTELISEITLVEEKTNAPELLSVKAMKKLNPSYRQYEQQIEQFLQAKVAEQLPVENLRPSLMLYRPHVFELGIYYVIKQGHQLNLYLYHFDQQENINVANIGNYEQEINLVLNISASDDGKQLVFSKVEGFETDILLQQQNSQE